ncbi:hypothetical protein [Nocardia alba]|uniref:Antibiotic biosynthesis monooxygenase n=1 Tax=Nocardia alba TaxID=225051 RepID=A0A4R1FEM7_9NOCA|nr:hypothetical protein [Nocardia alba]TCJ93216.1 hypothetical protein DFR71_5857 [Nocardia alba]
MTSTLHIDNTVHDFDDWKAAFDQYGQFRADNGVRACRVGRVDGTPHRVLVDLDFDDRAAAEAFRTALATVLATPRSRAMVISHQAWLVDLVDERISAR